MKIITSPTLSDQQKERVLHIWNTEYPVKLQMPGMADFDNFLNTLINPKHYLMIDNDDVIIGWGNKYYIGDVTCFFIMISGEIHGKGYGTTLLNELKKGEKQLFGWAIDHNNDIKADGRPYPSPINFYLKNNFTINTEMRLEDEQLSAVNILWEKE
ncbi:GNAT family N-acetyltransferase [Mucilaginibacter sp. BJC16-A38]|uniref:GNAT family N-acetyltransferase n=1 Tax=Mucilaginibacter phenanthrenivorans TaxID=1234842 RepID=UPI0021580548|nr:GNAT family N-acetyltransferase [Mucilaginibacter phenanthrenivorans]MCR8558033.1 GNAT family N-acetyltransferase [Mucilaginibacter phenanthrenivorans]